MTELRHELLDRAGVRHRFGTRDADPPRRVIRPQQVHGTTVASLHAGEAHPPDADAIVSTDSDCPVGIITADCVPILAAAGRGRAVVAIHAGWRGLAAGVVEAGIEALRDAGGIDVVAVVGPHIGPCCYEVDEPVIAPLRDRFGEALDAALRPVAGRPGHSMIDLGALVDLALSRSGMAVENRGKIREACTFCHPDRFHSYRRDGERAGRLLHWVQATPS